VLDGDDNCLRPGPGSPFLVTTPSPTECTGVPAGSGVVDPMVRPPDLQDRDGIREWENPELIRENLRGAFRKAFLRLFPLLIEKAPGTPS
jgi:hypothetical protein